MHYNLISAALNVINLASIIFQYAQRGVGVAILISTDGIKVISPDSQVIKFVCSCSSLYILNILLLLAR